MGKCKKCNKNNLSPMSLFASMILDVKEPTCLDCLIKYSETPKRDIKPSKICKKCKEEADIEINFLHSERKILSCTECYDEVNRSDKIKKKGPKVI
jgi:ubiquitin C-terminal hydrolase